jgi:hypothetical protein
VCGEWDMQVIEESANGHVLDLSYTIVSYNILTATKQTCWG